MRLRFVKSPDRRYPRRCKNQVQRGHRTVDKAKASTPTGVAHLAYQTVRVSGYSVCDARCGGSQGGAGAAANLVVRNFEPLQPLSPAESAI
jgi:hypothetical protein